MNKKKVLFITGTRADYGKMKTLMKALDIDEQFDAFIFVCGMHLYEKFGNTYKEILKDGYENVYIPYGLFQTQDGSINLGNTIMCLSGYVDHIQPDMIIVHGDRMDALAGAVVGALHNILVGHVEGGELSGTIDESIRHAVSKFAHIHFVCTDEARERLVQLGEETNRIFVIGSPDIDVMVSADLPQLSKVKSRYNIEFDHYGIMMYHPVTTEYDTVGDKIRNVVSAVIESKKNYVVIYPNNDLGSETIINEYKRFEQDKHFKLFPSLRFEYFLVLLKNAEFIIGNSSAGIRESGVYGVPAIDIGTRQQGRFTPSKNTNIQHVSEDVTEIVEAINQSPYYKTPSLLFGKGDSAKQFLNIVKQPSFWSIGIQKHFVDMDI